MLSEFLLGTRRARAFSVAQPHCGGLVARHPGGGGGAAVGLFDHGAVGRRNGREVMAIPGSIHSPQARGCHALIKQGAKLAGNGARCAGRVATTGRDCDDVLARLPLKTWRPIRGFRPDPVGHGFDPVSQEALSARTGMGPAELGARLLELELLAGWHVCPDNCSSVPLQREKQDVD